MPRCGRARPEAKSRNRDSYLDRKSSHEGTDDQPGAVLSFPLDAFDVELDPRRSPRLLGSRDRTLDHAAWSMLANLKIT
jgi:hypothetical protein